MQGYDRSKNQTLVSLLLVKPASIGMSLFFVLSSFVIHYNYFNRLKNFDGRQLHDFYTGRIARLFPLYFLLVGLEMQLGKAMLTMINGRSLAHIDAGYSIAALPIILLWHSRESGNIRMTSR